MADGFETDARHGSAGSPVSAGTSLRRLVIGLGLLAVLTIAGTAGYVAIADMSVLDALYMTVITLSTVGYSEVAELGPGGKLYTAALIVVGVGAVFYVVVALAAFFIEGRLQEFLGRRQMKKAIVSLSDHVIVCGFGRFGRAVSRQLRQYGRPVVVIEPNAAKEQECLDLGCHFLAGSALDDEVLAEAGIERARAIVAAIPNDSDNVFVALSAREANPEIHIHARAETPAGERRLHLSGANQVISPHQIGGQRIANAIARPGVVEFLELSAPGDGAEVDLEEIALSADSELAGVPIRDLSGHGTHVAVIAIKRGDEPLRIQPAPGEALQAGDSIVVVGDQENLRRLAALAAPPQPS